MARHPNRDRARELRTNQTPAERFVWYRLRYRQLGGFKFRRQHTLGPFIVDFVCLERKLVLELDGGQHADPTQADYDARRTAWLIERGYRVYRLWNIEAVGPSTFLEELYSNAPMIVSERIQQQANDLGRSLAVQLDVLAAAVPSFVEIFRRDLKHK